MLSMFDRKLPITSERGAHVSNVGRRHQIPPMTDGRQLSPPAVCVRDSATTSSRINDSRASTNFCGQQNYQFVRRFRGNRLAASRSTADAHRFAPLRRNATRYLTPAKGLDNAFLMSASHAAYN